MRTETTELSHCLEAVIREVLIRPAIDLEVKHNRSVVIRAPKTDSLVQRAKNLLGNAWGATIEIDFKVAGISVSGLVSPVGVHRASSQNASYLYVNQRYVRILPFVEPSEMPSRTRSQRTLSSCSSQD